MNKLHRLEQVIDIFDEGGVQMTGHLLKRKVIDGKSLLEIAHDGGPVREGAQFLVSIVQCELEQREMMDKRFVGRKNPSSAEPDFDFGCDAYGYGL